MPRPLSAFACGRRGGFGWLGRFERLRFLFVGGFLLGRLRARLCLWGGRGGGQEDLSPVYLTRLVDEEVEEDAGDVADRPVEGQAAGDGQGEPGEHEGHHPGHHLVHGLLTGVGGGGGHHALLDVGGDEDDESEDVRKVGLTQVHPQEAVLQGHGGLDVGPGVQLLG